jgi:hypothetical protein
MPLVLFMGFGNAALLASIELLPVTLLGNTIFDLCLLALCPLLFDVEISKNSRNPANRATIQSCCLLEETSLMCDIPTPVLSS